MSEHVNPEAAEQLVQEVSTWYAEQIIKERRAAVPDTERLTALKEELAACAADQQALQDAGPEEVAEIAARYAAHAKELGSQ
ncbi:hypothetical protein HRW18_32020 [Streptomyces lunaelactis]|uniref:hypothetical protein n=1 Tax=Streptomyces lunaelactis TaxID=1535768 RepID=UPI001585B929|nr:hypothetical protein [Streptomyces lunaelactis]NUK12521.1 hypothetical protein [Streptomyces lunaelactis]NUK75204.1 hypothetical protein [Streptomyces lunaelactis]NUL14647.1 hypothetical protein [Streptomyces lunaelactis]NUL27425.1 hypothetical protein [Streptomyces lunaelactis]